MNENLLREPRDGKLKTARRFPPGCLLPHPARPAEDRAWEAATARVALGRPLLDKEAAAELCGRQSPLRPPRGH